jgi:hypothetical protein
MHPIIFMNEILQTKFEEVKIRYFALTKKRLITLLFIFVYFCFITSKLFSQEASLHYNIDKVNDDQKRDKVLFTLAKAQKMLRFEQNVGQMDNAAVLFKAIDAQATYFFCANEFRSLVRSQKDSTAAAYAVQFVNADPSVRIDGIGRSRGTRGAINYHNGNGSFADVPMFERLFYKGLWGGVDALFYESEGGSMEYDFIVQPNADPSQVRFRLEGATDIKVNAKGELEFTSAFGVLQKGKPYTYQVIDGKTVEVESQYVVENGEVSFKLGKYDPSVSLTIDPIALKWSSFLGGGTGTKSPSGIYVHPATGRIYIAGYTASPNFPNTLGRTFNSSGVNDGFITCIEKDGTTIVWSTYLGGNAVDQVQGISVDAAGDVYVAGMTQSADFPVNGTNAAYDATHNGGRDFFVMRLNSTGSTIKYATFLGGPNNDCTTYTQVSLVEQNGKVYYSGLGGVGFPVTAGAFPASNNGGVFFCVNTNLSGALSLEFSIATQTWNFFDMTSDKDGNIWLSGASSNTYTPTISSNAVQPSLAALDPNNQLDYWKYLAKYSPTGQFLYGTYIQPVYMNSAIGGYGYRMPEEMEITTDKDGNLYFTSSVALFGTAGNTANILRVPNIGSYNEITPNNTSFWFGSAYLTYLGRIPYNLSPRYDFIAMMPGDMSGDNYESAEIDVDKKGNIHFLTWGGNYYRNQFHPVTQGAILPITNVERHAEYYVLNPSGSSVLYGTALNTSYTGEAHHIFVDDNCQAHMTVFGNTASFPVTPTYRDQTTNTQKAILQPNYGEVNNNDIGIMVFHDPVPNNNTIPNFASGNNTFCIGGAIWQNPNDGPILGATPTYTSGDGSSATHNLPNLRRGGITTPHPTPQSPQLQYQWQKRVNGGAWTNVGNGTYEVYKPQPEPAAGTVEYRRLMTDYCGAVLSTSNTASATIAGTFNLQINVPSGVIYYCPGTATPLGITVTGASGNISWQWYDGYAPLSTSVITPASGSGVAQGSFTASLATTMTGSGFYRLVVIDAGGCRRETFVAVAPKVESAGTAASMALCPGTTASITLGPASPNPLFDYSWTGPSGYTSTNPNPTVTTAGTYTLQVKLKTDGTFCAPGTTVTVTAATAHSATLTALPDKQFCQSDSPAGIGSSATPPAGYVFQWVPGTNLDNQVAFNPKFDPGAVPSNGFPIGSIEYTFSALRLSDGCIYEDKIIVTDTARALAQAGIDKPACGPNPSAVFGAPETTGGFFQWRAVATTYPGGVPALTSHTKFRMDGVATNLGTNKFLTTQFPDHTACYTIDYEIIASYVPITGGTCVTRDTARLFYCPACGGGIWCSDLTSNAEGTNGACAGSTNWIGAGSLAGLTYTWETHSVNGVVQSGSNREPRGLYYLNADGTKGALLPTTGAHPSIAIVDFDNASWGWPGANVVIYRLRGNGNFGEGVIDCHRDIQVFSASSAIPAIGIKDQALCTIIAPGIRLGTAGKAGPYTLSGIDYTQAPNSAFNWTWTGLNGLASSAVTAGANTRFPTINPTISTALVVKAQDPATGCFAKDTMNIDVRGVTANAGTDLSNICPGSLVQLGTTAVSGHTYSWSPSAGLNFPIGTPNSTTAQPYLTVPSAPTPPAALSYTVTVTDGPSGCQATDAVVVNTTTTAPPALTAASYNACPSSTFTIGPSGILVGATYTWTVVSGTGATTSWLSSTTVRQPTVTLPAGFTGAVFRLTMTKGTCGSVFADYTINNSNPAIILTSPVSASCASPFTQIGETEISGYSYTWFPITDLFTNNTLTTAYTGGNLARPWVRPLATATTYTVTRTNSTTGCVQTATVTVNPPTGVAVNAGADKTYCPSGTATTIGSTGSGTLSWSAIGYSASTQISAPPTTIASPMTSATMLTYIGGSANAATRSFPASGTPPAGVYVYRVTSTNGTCSITDDVMVTVANMPTGLVGLPQTICPGETVRLGSATTYTSLSYNWSAINPSSQNASIDVPSAQRPYVTPSVTTTYQLLYTDAGTGCSADEQVTVVVNAKPNIADVSMSPICTPTATNLTAQVSGYGSLVNPIWYRSAFPGGTVVSTPTSVTPTTTTNYFLVAANSNGCLDTAQITVNVSNPTTPNIQPSFQLSCSSLTVNLLDFQGSPSKIDHTFEWHNANNTSTTSFISNTNVGAGTYYLFEKASAPSNCFSMSDVITIIPPPTPSANAGVDVTVTCTTPSATLTASGGGTYLWSNGATTVSITVTPTVTTTYTVTVTATNGCTATDNVVVTANKTTPSFTFIQTDITCYGANNGTLTITASGGQSPYEYSINNGMTYQSSNSFTNLAPALYQMTVKDANGCIITCQ